MLGLLLPSLMKLVFATFLMNVLVKLFVKYFSAMEKCVGLLFSQFIDVELEIYIYVK